MDSTPREVLVAVVGSLNTDLIADVVRAPRIGETILATSFAEHPGGKGLNQAVACAALTPTAMVGAVGDDDAGTRLSQHLRTRSIDTRFLTQVTGPTGLAFITLFPDGDNSIVVAPGANLELTAQMVTRALTALSPAVVVVQFEVLPATVDAAVSWASGHGRRIVVNPSPMRHDTAYACRHATPLVVNAGEARSLTNSSDSTPLDDVARQLARVASSVVVTAGASDCLVARGTRVDAVDVPAVHEVRDSSGAGDIFTGTLAGHLASGADLTDAVASAVQAAGDAVGRRREQRYW